MGLHFHSESCLIFQNACEKMANMKNTKETFQVTGLEPFNFDIFSNDDFLPSDVSNWLQGNWNEDPTGENDRELQMPLSIKKKAAESHTSGNSVQNKLPPKGS
jgi:hypothetical protein